MARTRTSQQYEGKNSRKPQRGHLSAPYIPCAPPLWGCRQKLNYHEKLQKTTLTGVDRWRIELHTILCAYPLSHLLPSTAFAEHKQSQLSSRMRPLAESDCHGSKNKKYT